MENTNDRKLQANSSQRENEQPDTQDFGLIDNPNEIRLDGSDTAQQSQYASARDEDDEDDDRDDDDDLDTDDDDDDDDFDNDEAEEDEAPAQSDWGVVDPLEHPAPPHQTWIPPLLEVLYSTSRKHRNSLKREFFYLMILTYD